MIRSSAESAILHGMQLPDFPRRVAGAALLDVDLYNEVEADASLNKQATAVVVAATTLAGIGSAVATDSNVFLGMASGALTGLLGWIVWSAIAMFVGTKVFGGTSDFGEMARVIGFAYAPLAIGVVPWLGIIGAIWSLLASVIAIREGMDFSTPRAIATMAVGWGTWFLVSLAAQAWLGLEFRGVWEF